MLPLFNGRKVASDGRLSVLLRTSAIPASVQRSGGWAMDADGRPYVDIGPVGSDRVFNQGIAFTPDGAMYVTDDAPTSTSIKIDGVAVSASGAVHYTVVQSPPSGGIGLSSNGSLSLGNEIASFSLDLQSSAIPEYSIGSGTPTFTRATTKYVLGYAASAVVTDDPILIQCASGEIGFTGARRVSEGVWSSYDANGVFLSTTNGASALCCDAYGPFGYNAEGARTNLCLQSQTFGTTWSAIAMSLTENDTTAPDGTATADKLLETTDNSSHRATQSITHTAVATTFSVWVKGIGRTWIGLYSSDGVNEMGRRFELSGSGTVGQQYGALATTGTITAFPNGWYRCSITATMAAGAGSTHIFTAEGDGTSLPTFVGDVTKGIYVWGAQMEVGSFASSYIPTTTAAVTRNADVLTYAAAGNIAAATGGVVAEAKTVSASTSVIISTANASGLLFCNAATSVTGDDQANSVSKTGLTDITSAIRKRAFAWGGSAISITGDGATPETGTFDGGIGVDAIAIGCTPGGASSWNGNIRNVRIYPQALSSAQLEALTA